MTVSDSVSQAIKAGAIAQSTIDELGTKAATSKDSRALATLQDAIDEGVVEVR
ncbi:MAG: hypothetical protein AAGL17_18875 [Cyanobacteria bacterium J06576_12]